MRKRWIALVLALVMAASLVGCVRRRPNNQNRRPANTQPYSQPVEVTLEPTQAETEPPTEPPTQPPVPPSVYFPDVTDAPCIPFLQSIGDAVLAYNGEVNENEVYLGYANGTVEELEMFVALCGFCGMYRTGEPKDPTNPVYYLLRPGSDSVVIASLMTEEDILYIQFPRDLNGISADDMDTMLDYYLQELKLPTGYGPDVMPEFYASIGRTGADVDGLVSNIFSNDAESCWFEMYEDVDYPMLHQYLSDMMLCGFDIKYDGADFGEGTMVVSARYMLDNGSSRVAVFYDAENDSVTVYYEPGANRYLLSGTEYTRYIPQP